MDWPLLLFFPVPLGKDGALREVLVFKECRFRVPKAVSHPHSVSGMPGGRAAKQRSLVLSWMRRKNSGPCKVCMCVWGGGGVELG